MRMFRHFTSRRAAGEDQPRRRILIADDDSAITCLITTTLDDPRYDTVQVSDGVQAIRTFDSERFDAIILDVMMPFVDGFQVCSHIRERSDVPIIMLTAREGTEDVVHGFELGADDYITKPFRAAELQARVEAIMRRVESYQQRHAPPIVHVGDVVINEPRHEVIVRNSPVNLTPMEFELLYFLAANAGQVFNRETLYREVWRYEHIGETNLVDVCVRRLREKIEVEPSRPQKIITVRGVGYKFAEEKPG